MGYLTKLYLDILFKDDTLIQQFMQAMIEEHTGLEMFLEMLIDASDHVARNNANFVVKNVLCRLKMIEKDLLM